MARGPKPGRGGTERLYGRQRGHALSPEQDDRLARLLPDIRVDLSTPAPDSSASLFQRPVEALVLEIGFGAGEHLIRRATENPQTGFIGVEPYLNGVAKVLRAIETGPLDNIRIHDHDARDLLDWLPDAALDRIDLLYPDPWPKVRHWKRRFLGPENLDRMERVLKPGSEIHFATDIATYVDWALFHVRAHPAFEWTARRPEDWRMPWAGWPGTRYEAKAIREGRTPHYLTFRRI